MRPFTDQELKKLIIPILLEQTLGVTVGIINTAMVSNAGEAAVAGVSLVETINILLVNLFVSLSTGGAVVAARYIGRKNEKEGCKAADQLLLTTTVLSLTMTAFVLIGGRGLLSLVYGSVEKEVLDNATAYFFFSGLSYPALAIYNSSAALCRSMGNTKVTLKVSLLINAITVSGNIVLITVLHMGAEGAGISSMVSRYTGAVIIFFVVRDRKRPIHYDAKFRLGYYPAIIKEIMSIGVPTVVDNCVFQVGKLLVQGLVSSYGTASIAANAVIGSVAGFSVIPSSAIGIALLVVVGQTVGTRVYEDVVSYIRKLMKWTYIAMLVLNLALIAFSTPLIGLFGLSPGAFKMARGIMVCNSIANILLYPMAFTLPNALRALDDARFTMAVSIFSMWFWRIGSSYLLGNYFGLGLYGVWLAMFVDWLFRGACFGLRMARGKWRK